MSFDGTIQLLSPRTRVSSHPVESQLAHLRRVAPVTFRLDLGDGGGGGGCANGVSLHTAAAGRLRAPAACGVPAPPSQQQQQQNVVLDNTTTMMFSMDKRIARLMFIAQVLIVFVLSFMVFSLLFLSWRLHYNANWAYGVAQPYMSEAMNHSMAIMRHAHNSSEALEVVMNDGRTISTTAVPAIAHSLNRSVAMVERMQQIAANPVVKVSLGSV